MTRQSVESRHYSPGADGWVIRNEYRPNPRSSKRIGTYWYGASDLFATTFGALSGQVAVFPTKLAAEEAYRAANGQLRIPMRAQRVSHAEAESSS